MDGIEDCVSREVPRRGASDSIALPNCSGFDNRDLTYLFWTVFVIVEIGDLIDAASGIWNYIMGLFNV